ncbi:MAG: glycoside hydrolase family 2 [Planctomycetota bacterium]|nr:MAG: glycoside hydrolase family 2 [Planctomycetota bacterium]
MMGVYKYCLCAAIVVIAAICCLGCAGDTNVASGVWPFEIEVRHRPGTYWWCPGSAWDEESIDWNLENLKAGGIGTVHIVPIYGAKGYEDRYITFLSKEWVEKLQYILKKAESLGMQVDMTTGTGWCFGGPDLAKDHWDTRAVLDKKTGKFGLSANRMVKRAAPGGVGHMLNPFSQGAITTYIDRFDKALAGLEILPRAQYHDSFEYSGNWCAEMPDEFRKRRGYDLNDYLKVVFGGDEDKDKAARIKYDYRLTAAELHREFIETWADWSQSKGMLTRNQAHGSPANLLDVYAAADIPETEMFGSPEFPIPGFRHDERFTRRGDSDPRICRMASSAAHVAHATGKQLVSSESCTWMREHWHGTLGQIKLEMDLFFLMGINHVFYHGSCYSAKDAPWPGWFFYASTKADWRNSIWRDMPLLNDYIARCQSVLQAGEPANDVLVYWPIHDLWMDSEGLLKPLKVHDNSWIDKQRVGELANLLDSKGYAYDFVSDRMLDSIRYQNGQLRAPGGTYKVILVPRCTFMPAGTMKRLADLAGQGASIIFGEKLPSDVPGYGNLAERRAEFAREKSRLKKVVIAKDAVSGLERVGVQRERLADHGLRYIRRRVGSEYWYFIANHTDQAVTDWVSLAAPFVSAVRHDPMGGHSVLLPTQKKGKVYLDIWPGETFIIQASTSELRARPFVPTTSAGAAFELQGKWEIEFVEGGPVLPAGYSTDSLSSWTDAPDERAKAFAGTGRYRLTFELPDGCDADDYLLDLGDVRESARVKINGAAAADLFAPPMRARVGRYLKKGVNTIEIEVTNLAANRMRDLDLRGVDWKIMNDINIVNQNYKKFDAAKWPLQPSGLLGPVTLRPLKRSSPLN